MAERHRHDWECSHMLVIRGLREGGHPFTLAAIRNLKTAMETKAPAQPGPAAH